MSAYPRAQRLVARALAAVELLQRNPQLLEAAKKFSDAGNARAARASRSFIDLQKTYGDAAHDTMTDLLRGKITGQQAVDQMSGEIRRSFERSYLTGKERILGRSVSLNVSDRAYLRNATEAEVAFFRGFVSDVASGGGKMAYGRRTDLYIGSLRGAHTNAMLEYAGDGKRVEVYWDLGVSEHCEDCLSLSSMNPWTKESIPTCPGCGDTRCGGHCRCSLSFRELSASAAKDSAKRSDRPGTPSSLWALPDPPGGRVLPNDPERFAIESMYGETNYWRRAAQDATIRGAYEEAEEALRMRRQVNDRLIRYMDGANPAGRRLWAAPAISRDEALSGRMLNTELVDSLLEAGLDGLTISALPSAEVSRLLKSIAEDAQQLDVLIADQLRKTSKESHRGHGSLPDARVA